MHTLQRYQHLIKTTFYNDWVIVVFIYCLGQSYELKLKKLNSHLEIKGRMMRVLFILFISYFIRTQIDEFNDVGNGHMDMFCIVVWTVYLPYRCMFVVADYCTRYFS